MRPAYRLRDGLRRVRAERRPRRLRIRPLRSDCDTRVFIASGCCCFTRRTLHGARVEQAAHRAQTARCHAAAGLGYYSHISLNWAAFQRDSNPLPIDVKAIALPNELWNKGCERETRTLDIRRCRPRSTVELDHTTSATPAPRHTPTNSRAERTGEDSRASSADNAVATKYLAGHTGFEPVIYGSTGRRELLASPMPR